MLPLFALSLCGCNNNRNIESSSIKVYLNLSNFARYISSTRYEGFTGASSFSPYKAWFDFKGLLTIGIYDVTVTYSVDNASYTLKLDASGSGKTDYFDRLVDSGITNVSGTVSYLEPNTRVDLDLSNFESYISYAKYEGYTGVAGSSPYKAWLEFKGTLLLGLYDVTVTYVVYGTSYNFNLDASGSGKTDPFDRSLAYSVKNVSGFVKYSV